MTAFPPLLLPVFLVLEHGSATYPLTGAAMLRVFLGGGERGGKREEDQGRGGEKERGGGGWEKEKMEGGKVGEEERKERRRVDGKGRHGGEGEGLDEGRRREERRTEGWRRKEVRKDHKDSTLQRSEAGQKLCVCDIFEPKSTAQSNIPFFLHVCLLWLWIHCCL